MWKSLKQPWLAFGFSLVFGPAIFSGCCSPKAGHSDESLNRYEFTEPQMGMPFRIVLYAPDQTQAAAAATAAFQRVTQLNAVLSDYDTDSELSRLSQTAGQGQTVKLSPDLWFILERAQSLARRTHGAFDATAGPYISLWRKARRTKELPSARSLALARETVGYGKLRLIPRDHTAQLMLTYMRLDLGGIAKGYALDEALKVLKQQGITRALVTGGGDMAVGEPPPGKPGWRIEIAPLDVTNAPPKRFVLLRNVGLATSGDLFQHVEINGKRYSHIVDPRTGLGLTDHSLVTVIAPTAITADSLATAVSVLGPVAGRELIEQTPGVAAYMVRQPEDEIETFASKRLPKYLETTE